MEIMEEKCIICNGTSKSQKFNVLINKWERSEDICQYCKGAGLRAYILFHSGKNFLNTKHYLTL